MFSELKEQYLLAIADMQKQEKFYVVVEDRKKLAKMLELMPDKYTILEMGFLANVKKYEDFMTTLTEEGKPDGLNFGRD